MATLTTTCNCGNHGAAQSPDLIVLSERDYIATLSEYGDTGTTSGALGLLSGATWGGSGSGTTIRYNFLDDVPSYYRSTAQERLGFQGFNAQMRSATEEILNQIETFTNITFTKSAQTSQQITFGQAYLGEGIGGWAYYPNSTDARGGDVWTNRGYSNTQNPEDGNYAKLLLLHEIGHALGLQHSFERLSGVEASSQYSVMAYDWSPYYPSGYMLYDVYALQRLYGANMAHATGDDVYDLNSKNIAYAIWDAGGNDTLDASTRDAPVVLNLNDGAYSSAGLGNNIAIAFNAVIENAWGGRNNDRITGNEANNILRGNAGDDILVASQGDDVLDGGTGNDHVIYSTNIEDFLISIVDSMTVELSDGVGSYGTDTLISIENFTFNATDYSFDDLVLLGTPADPDARVVPPANAVFSYEGAVPTTVADAAEINTGNATEKTIGLAFETGVDVANRQVLFEQGGGLRGINIYIENGELFHAAWNYKAGTEWGYKTVSIGSVETYTAYTTLLSFEALSSAQGTIEGYLDGVLGGTLTGTGTLFADAGGVGIGQMVDQSRFVDGNVRGDGYAFSGTIENIIYYNTHFADSFNTRINDYLAYDWLGANRNPDAVDDSIVIDVDTPTVVTVLANDNDRDGDTIDVVSATNGTNGIVTVNSLDNTILYTPDVGYEGADSFTYTIDDGNGGTDTATVNVWVGDLPPAERPMGMVVAHDANVPDTLASAENIDLAPAIQRTIALSFETGDDVSSRQVLFEQGGGLRGIAIFIENGEVFHSAWNYRADNEWAYKVTSVGMVTSNTAHATTFVFDANSGTIETYLDGVSGGTLSGISPLAEQSAGIGIGQMVEASRFAEGNVRGDGYVFEGAVERFSYYDSALSGSDLSDLNTYHTQDWVGGNRNPDAVDDTVETALNVAHLITPLDNDSDPDGDALDVTSTTQGAHGVVTLDTDNDTLLYTPDTGYEGADSFTYTIADGNGGTDTATVNVWVGGKPAERPDGAVFAFDGSMPSTVADAPEINLDSATGKTIALAFETGADVTARQVLFEQGGGLRGISIFIENGELHHAAWNYRAGTEWGYKLQTVGSVASNTDYTTTFIFDAQSDSSGTLTSYLDGASTGTLSGLGRLYADAGDVGIGQMVDQSRFAEGNVRYGDYAFTGTLKSISYYNSVLDAGEISQLNDYTQEQGANYISAAPEHGFPIYDDVLADDALLAYEPQGSVTPVAQDPVAGGGGVSSVSEPLPTVQTEII